MITGWHSVCCPSTTKCKYTTVNHLNHLGKDFDISKYDFNTYQRNKVKKSTGVFYYIYLIMNKITFLFGLVWVFYITSQYSTAYKRISEMKSRLSQIINTSSTKCRHGACSSLLEGTSTYLKCFDRLWLHRAFLRDSSYMFPFEMQSISSDK